MADALTVPPNPKPPKISRKIRRAINSLARGATQREAATLSGISDEHLCRELKRPHVAALLNEEVRALIARGTVRAGRKLVDLIDSPSQKVSLDASKHVLGLGHIVPPSAGGAVQVNVGVAAGYVIDLRGADGHGPVIAPPEPVKQLPASPIVDAEPTIANWHDVTPVGRQP